MRTITILAASAAALPCVPAMAQVSASGTTRLRVETIDGQARAGFNENDTLLNLRTTLAAQYEEGPVKVVGELWDRRLLVTSARAPMSEVARPDAHSNSCSKRFLLQENAEQKFRTGPILLPPRVALLPGHLGKGSGRFRQDPPFTR